MNKSKKLLAAGLSVVAVGVAATASAQQPALCTGNDQEEITVVLRKDDQVELSCANFFGPGPTGELVQMVDAASLGAVDVVPSNGSASWSLAAGAPLNNTGDLAIAKSFNGQVCVYQYLADVVADAALTAPGAFRSVTVCTDQTLRGTPIDPGEDPEPIATGEDCADFALQDGVDDRFDIAFAVKTGSETAGAGNEQQLAFCSNQSSDPDNTQTRCVDRCETPVVGPLDCDGPLPDGRLPIECRTCATSGAPDNLVPAGPNIGPGDNLKYCWELSHRATEDSFRPLTLQPGGEFSWERARGSLCYLMRGRTSGGYPYAYWISLDGGACPCDPALDGSCTLIR